MLFGSDFEADFHQKLMAKSGFLVLPWGRQCIFREISVSIHGAILMPSMLQNSTPNRACWAKFSSKIAYKMLSNSTSIFKQFFNRFWDDLGTNLGAFGGSAGRLWEAGEGPGEVFWQPFAQDGF